MKRSFLLTSLTLFSLFISLISFAPAGKAGMVDGILSETNKFRRSKGLPALIMKDELNAIAKKHSEDMAKKRVGFGHAGFSKRNSQAMKVIKPMNRFAENVAHGATSAKEVVTGWKNSPPHRRNMLGNYKYIGIGIAKDKRGRIFYTQVFAG